MTCTFCNIISTQDPEIILYEDEHCIAFKDIKPAAEFHLLVVPKIHKASVHTLNGNDADLIQHMQQVGQQLLDQKGISVENQLMGFHIPPLVLIPHLHLHVIGMPFNGLIGKALFSEWSITSWFINSKLLLESLIQSGNKHGSDEHWCWKWTKNIGNP